MQSKGISPMLPATSNGTSSGPIPNHDLRPLALCLIIRPSAILEQGSSVKLQTTLFIATDNKTRGKSMFPGSTTVELEELIRVAWLTIVAWYRNIRAPGAFSPNFQKCRGDRPGKANVCGPWHCGKALHPLYALLFANF